jgi:hypothetical protein
MRKLVRKLIRLLIILAVLAVVAYVLYIVFGEGFKAGQVGMSTIRYRA